MIILEELLVEHLEYESIGGLTIEDKIHWPFHKPKLVNMDFCSYISEGPRLFQIKIIYSLRTPCEKYGCIRSVDCEGNNFSSQVLFSFSFFINFLKEKSILYRILVCQSKDNSFRSKYFIGNKIQIWHITFVKFLFDHSQPKKKKKVCIWLKSSWIKWPTICVTKTHKNIFIIFFFIIQLK